MTAPLVFNEQPKKPVVTTGASKPLDFGGVKTPSTSQGQTARLVFGDTPRPRQQPVPDAAPRVVKPAPLDFSSVPTRAAPVVPPPVPAGPVQTRAAFIDHTDSDVPLVMKLMESANPTMFHDPSRRMKAEVQVKQLLPLTINVVMVWGDKPLSFLASQTTSVTNLVREISNMRAYELIEEAQKALVATPSLFQRLKGEDHVMLFKPKLAVIRSNIGRWLSEADRLVQDTTRTEVQMTTCMATFGAVLTFLGQIPDNSLEMATNQRRMTLQQAAMQAQSLVLQVDQQRKSLYTLKNALDAFLDVTLPAYETAKASR